jgi:serine/threonine protein phosphatase PrpC
VAELEKERLLKAGATLNCLYYDGEPSGPLRIFKGTLPYPGLVVSRAFGDDVGKKIGVLVKPDIITIQELKNDTTFVIACDGVWDATTNQEVAALAHKFLDNPQFASEQITSLSKKKLELSNLSDNITNIVVKVLLSK